jgi:hypothetical protein
MHHRGTPTYQSSAIVQYSSGEQQTPVDVGLRRQVNRGGARGQRVIQPLFDMPQDYGEGMRGPGVHGTPVLGAWMAASGGRGEASGRRRGGHSSSARPRPTAHTPLHEDSHASEGGKPDPESARGQAENGDTEEKQEKDKLGDVNDPTSLAWRLQNTTTIPSMELDEFFDNTRVPWIEVVQQHPQASRLVGAATVHQGSIWAIFNELGRGGFG